MNSILEIKILLNMTHKNQPKYKGIYLLRKIIVCFVGHVENSQATTPPSCFRVLLESPWWTRLHWDGLPVFSLMVQELLNIEQFSQRKSINIRSKYFFCQISAHFLYYCKTFDDYNLMEVINLYLSCWRYWIFLSEHFN